MNLQMKDEEIASELLFYLESINGESKGQNMKTKTKKSNRFKKQYFKRETGPNVYGSISFKN